MLSWAALLLVLCSSLSSVLCCDWLRHYGHLSNTSLILLRHMGGELTKQDCPVPFPYRLYERIQNSSVESQLVFIKDSLELIAGLYHHDNRSSVAWDTDKTERFLMTIHRQMDGLSSCVSTSRPADSKLRKYYRRLETSTLYRTGGSAGSWELIRRESRRHLLQLDLLVAFIRNSTAASGRHSTPTPRQH